MTPTETVQAFLAALERLDVEAAGALLHPDVVYTNVPFPPLRGKGRTEQALASMVRYGSAFEVEYHHVAADGPVVLTERTDVLGVGPLRAAFWVCGTFEVHDGLITVWRDRFDLVDFALAWVRAVGKLLVQR